MKRFVRRNVWMSILSLSLCLSCTCLNSLAFASRSHEYTTQRGIDILDSVQSEQYSAFYTEEDRKQILIYCTRPDDDEITGAFKYHFFNPATEKNFMGEEDSALRRCTSHYEKALENFKNGRRRDAFEELGRSLHFLEDLNTPVHTNNQDFIDTAINVFFHVNFEKRCEEIQSNVVSSLLKKEFRYYKENSLENIAKSCAYLANDNFYALYENILSKDQVAKNSIKNAQKAVAGVLYKFYLDVN